jgi:hypothetical protein
MTLWRFVIKEGPQSVPLAYNNRGVVFENMGRFDRAMVYFQVACDSGERIAFFNGLRYSSTIWQAI